MTSSLHHSLQQWSPQQNPKIWSILNTLCFLYSLFFIIIVLVDGSSTNDDKNIDASSSSKSMVLVYYYFAQTSYLWYNLITSLVWFVESGLSFHYVHTTKQQQEQQEQRQGQGEENESINAKTIESSLDQILEFILAIYFLIDSIDVINQWKSNLNETDRSMLLNSGINALAYLYMIYEYSFRRRQKSAGWNTRSSDGDGDDDDDDGTIIGENSRLLMV